MNIGIPIVFDYHHHKFCTGDLSNWVKFLALVSKIVHYSESKV